MTHEVMALWALDVDHRTFGRVVERVDAAATDEVALVAMRAEDVVHDLIVEHPTLKNKRCFVAFILQVYLTNG